MGAYTKYKMSFWMMVVGSLSWVAVLPAAAQLPHQGPQDLFVDTPAPEHFEDTPHPTVVRRRAVRVDWDFASQPPPEPGDSLSLNLFDDVSLVGLVSRIEYRGPASYNCAGSIVGEPNGTFTLVLANEVMVANIYVTGLGSYQIRYVGDGVHVVQQIDDSQSMPCGGVIEAERGPAAMPARSGTRRIAAADDGSVIDLLVVYTPEARAGAGGTAAMEAVVDLLVLETNIAFENSGIYTSIRLVYRGETDYVESHDAVTEVTRLRQVADGHMDDVHVLRDQYGADLVSLLVNDFNACGIGYLGVSSAALGFSVTDWHCGSLTFAHELGHNMGCHHDRQNACSSAACSAECCAGDSAREQSTGEFSYSYGYRFWGDSGYERRTIMAYLPGIRIPHFSNPEVFFEGQETGIPEGEPDSANSVLTINNTSLAVANFRGSVCLDVESNCGDGLDNDCDGLVDCSDVDCSDAPVCLCDNDGICEMGEDCTCPNDCISGAIAACGNGVCEAGDGENCLSCPEDCNGKQNGNPARRYCCGDGGGENPTDCGDPRCVSEGLECSDEPTDPYCCGDGFCEGAEDSATCEIDCGPPSACGDGTCDLDESQCSCSSDCGSALGSETNCADGVDEDCDGLIDCVDPDCEFDAACDACTPTHSKEKGPRCADGIDNDCDGMIDEEDPDCQ